MKTIARALLVMFALAPIGCTKTAAKNHADEPVKAEGSEKSSAAAAPAADTRSLYQRLGGKEAITAVVNDFTVACAGDKRIAAFFKATAADKKRLAHLNTMLVDQICEATGGPCKYKGKDMKSTHKSMGIKESHFNALVENLVNVLNKYKVGKTEQDELLAALGGMKKDIVTK